MAAAGLLYICTIRKPVVVVTDRSVGQLKADAPLKGPGPLDTDACRGAARSVMRSVWRRRGRCLQEQHHVDE